MIKLELSVVYYRLFMFDVQEIGDVENWARSIEGDMLTVTTVLDYVHKGTCTCGHDNTFTLFTFRSICCSNGFWYVVV